MSWIRLPYKTLTDPQMGKLTDSEWRKVIEFRLIASQYDRQGKLPGLSDVAGLLVNCWWEAGFAQKWINNLIAVGQVEEREDGYYIPNFHLIEGWEKDYQSIAPLVYERDDHKCRYCGDKAEEIDHVTPRCQGGSDRIENLVASCRYCNRSKGGRTPEQAGMELINA